LPALSAGNAARTGSAPGQADAALASCDAVVSTRMHGLVLALRAGVPAVGVDPVPGGVLNV
jgi:hypothetical protein